MPVPKKSIYPFGFDRWPKQRQGEWLWDNFRKRLKPAAKRGRPKGESPERLQRDISMVNHYLTISKQHPDWPLTKRCREIHKNLNKEYGAKAPTQDTIRRKLTEIFSAARKKVERLIPKD
jgi:hypothetical protein